MKNLFIILLFISCNRSNYVEFKLKNDSLHYKIIKIDNCEYIYGYPEGTDNIVLVHKGDCHNLIHKNGF